MVASAFFPLRFISKLVLAIVFSCCFGSCAEFQEVGVTQIGQVKILKISPKGIEMEIGLKIKNPNAYGFTIYRSSFDVKLGETDLGTATLSKKEKVKANSEDMHVFHITTDVSKLMQGGLGGIMALLGKQSGELILKGNLKVGKFLIRKSIPIERKQRVNLDNQAGGSLF
jgi:LEA14-like dessication related protein